eukprot:25744-Eustigmatos_ZCMA.PRE.1
MFSFITLYQSRTDCTGYGSISYGVIPVLAQYLGGREKMNVSNDLSHISCFSQLRALNREAELVYGRMAEKAD